MAILIKNVITGVCILLSVQVWSQTEKINQLDENGKRHGVWKKHFENGNQLRYEGTFEHGKEISTFKFYKLDQEKPAATKTFNKNNDSVVMKFYDHKGRIESEGVLVDENREGTWRYYKKGFKEQPIMTEKYKNNQLHGWKTIYYPDGQPAEKTYFKNGLKDGELIIYSERSTILQQYNYKNDKLQGNSKVFDASENVISEGNYKQGHRDGEWKFYTDGKLDSIQKYPLPKPVKKK